MCYYDCSAANIKVQYYSLQKLRWHLYRVMQIIIIWPSVDIDGKISVSINNTVSCLCWSLYYCRAVLSLWSSLQEYGELFEAETLVTEAGPSSAPTSLDEKIASVRRRNKQMVRQLRTPAHATPLRVVCVLSPFAVSHDLRLASIGRNRTLHFSLRRKRSRQC